SGTGPALVTAALCEILGDAAVTTIEADPQLAEAARAHLAHLGHRPRVVRGDGLAGCPGERFDAILLSFAVRGLPPALLEQLAHGGRLLAPITTGAVGWPAQAMVRRTGDTLDAVLAPVASGHRPGLGVDLVTAPERMPDGPVTIVPSHLAPPQEAGFWLAVGHLLPGLVRVAVGERLSLYAPTEESCAVVRSDGGSWVVEHIGPRNIWAEVETVHARWVQAGRPGHYRLDLTDPAVQRVDGGAGAHPLTWRLPGHFAPAAVAS
ncbi:protein-L-isoaspartate O-methyltransferase, partial [Streptomyces sp. 2MCAF27]